MQVRVARIGKPFGVAGEVTVRLFTDEPERRLAAGSVLFSDSGEFSIDRSRQHGNTWLLHVNGVNDRNAAEALRGTELYAEVPADEEPSGEDEWFDRDLIGLPCRETTGQSVGEIVAVEHPPAHDVLVIRTTAGHEARVPFVSAIVLEVDAAGVLLDPPGGLLAADLEAESP